MEWRRARHRVHGVAVGVEFDYKLNVSAAGSYNLNFGVASPMAGSFDVYVNGAWAKSYTVSNTGSWTNYATTSQAVNLATGSNTIAIVPKAGSLFNVNAITLSPVNPTGGGGVSGNSNTVTSSGALTISADKNSGISNAKIEYQNGTPDVGYMSWGGYVEYTLNVQTAGNYSIGVNTASPGSGS